MLKRKIFLFQAILLGFAIQFGVQNALAFSDNNEDPVWFAEQCGWQIELVSVEEFDDDDPDTDKWVWNYEITQTKTGRINGLNFAAMLIPDCFTEPKIDVDIEDSEGFKRYFPVGQGEPALWFGKFNQQARVLKGTSCRTANWRIVTNTNTMTASTILLKVRRHRALAFEMAVPGCIGDPVCGPQPQTSSIIHTSEEYTYVNSDGHPYKVNVYKDQEGEITEIIRTDPGGSSNITDEGIPVTEIMAKFPDSESGYIEEPFSFVPDGTVTKTGEDSTCGYWYRGRFWNFCY